MEMGWILVSKKNLTRNKEHPGGGAQHIYHGGADAGGAAYRSQLGGGAGGEPAAGSGAAAVGVAADAEGGGDAQGATVAGGQVPVCHRRFGLTGCRCCDLMGRH